MSINTALILLVLLEIKHFLADWVFQTDRMALQKGKNLDYLLLHGLHHTIGTILILVFFVPLSTAVIVGTLELGIHSAIDYLKSNKTLLGQYQPPSKAYFISLGFDQFLHQITYIAIIYFLAQ